MPSRQRDPSWPLLSCIGDVLVLAESLQRRLQESTGLALSQFRVLRVLAEQHAALTVGRIAPLVGVSQASLLGLIEDLEQRGLVIRESGLRSASLRISDSGLALLSTSAIWRDTDFARAAEHLSASEQLAFLTAIQRFTELVRLEGRAAASKGLTASH